MSIKPNPDYLIWIDLEMTGLDTRTDRIIEIATVITDSQLNIIAEGPEFAIHQPENLLQQMDSWNQSHHTSSGLYKRVQESSITEAEAEAETLDFVMRHVPPKKSPMCGNSICQDRRFLHRWMPSLEQYFHYRNLDVSTIKILMQRWSPEAANCFKKESQHLAKADIYDSIDELAFYRDNFFKLQTSTSKEIS